jgi:hypothetical protein
MSESSPLLQAARIWEKTSGKGTRHMQGRLGGVKVVIQPNRVHVEGDSANGTRTSAGSVAARVGADQDRGVSGDLIQRD